MQFTELNIVNVNDEGVMIDIKRPEYIYEDDQRKTIYSHDVITIQKNEISKLLHALEHEDVYKDIIKSYLRDYISSYEFRNVISEYAREQYYTMKYSEENK